MNVEEAKGEPRIMRNSKTLRSILVGLSLVLIAIVPVQGITVAKGVLKGQKICLDPGHGGTDPGAVNEDYELEEADINLDVAIALEGLLVKEGKATVVMTRTDNDTYMTNSDRYTFCNAEGADILVSVHTNSTIKTSLNGSMALYFHDDDWALAKAIYDVMYRDLEDTAPDDNFTDWGLSHFASGVLMRSDMPAAIMEPLCMSYAPEAKLLDVSATVTGSRRWQIAQAIYAGVLNYYDNPPQTPPEPGCYGPGCPR